MSPRAALFWFPFKTADATEALRDDRAHAAFVLVPPIVAGGYLLAHGVAWGDALATAAGFALCLLAMGLGGLAGLAPASYLLGNRTATSRLAGLCLLTAGWAGLLYPVLAVICRALVGPGLAPLTAAFVLLLWTAGVGISILDVREEAGRRLVVSCVGITGGLLATAAAVVFVARMGLVLTLPAPESGPGFPTGTPLLIRPGAEVEPGGVYLTETEGRLRFVRASRETKLPSEITNPPVGRVFFHFGEFGGRPDFVNGCNH
ncbi:MAG: hypothetical protein V3T86_12085 [Planctomycetota bacterium]